MGDPVGLARMRREHLRARRHGPARRAVRASTRGRGTSPENPMAALSYVASSCQSARPTRCRRRWGCPRCPGRRGAPARGLRGGRLPPLPPAAQTPMNLIIEAKPWICREPQNFLSAPSIGHTNRRLPSKPLLDHDGTRMSVSAHTAILRHQRPNALHRGGIDKSVGRTAGEQPTSNATAASEIDKLQSRAGSCHLCAAAGRRQPSVPGLSGHSQCDRRDA